MNLGEVLAWIYKFDNLGIKMGCTLSIVIKEDDF